MTIIKPKGESSREESRFYTLTEFSSRQTQERVDEILVHLRLHRMLTDKEEYCSRILEEIATESFRATKLFKDMGKQPRDHPLDGVFGLEKYRLGVEVKNIREWVYPMSGRIWTMVKKCLELDAIPFLITRKTAFITKLSLGELGIISFETHRQFFAHRVAHLLDRIQHTDYLGYKDVLAISPAPHPSLVEFIQGLPAQLAGKQAAWKASKDILKDFAIERDLGNPDMHDDERQDHYADFIRTVLYPESDEPDDEDAWI